MISLLDQSLLLVLLRKSCKAGVEFETVQALPREWLDSVTVLPEKIPAKIPFTPRAYRVLELAAD